MKNPLSIFMFVFLIGLVFYGCNEEQTPIQPESSNSLQFYKGTENLGNPEEESPPFSIAAGTGFVEVGIGMNNPPPGQAMGTGNLYVPGTVEQAIIYWAGGNESPTTIGDDQIEVNGNVVTGTLIGGVASFAPIGDPPVSFYSFRADITGLVVEGDNTFEITQLAFTQQTDGVSIVVIYNDGVSPFADIQFRDGLDLAYFKSNPDADATVKQSFTFDSAPYARTAYLHLIVGSVKENRPNVTKVWVDGSLTQFDDKFYSADGKDWDSPILEVDVPANKTTLEVQLFSEKGPSSTFTLQPASLLWITAALSIEEPEEYVGCNLTQGYWKTHADPNKPKKFNDTWLNYMTNGVHNEFYGSGYTYLTVMKAPSKKNAYFILAQQYVAALLNKAAGSSVPQVVADALSEADDLYSNYLPDDIYGLKGDHPTRKRFIEASEILDDYNNGRLGVPHCDD